MHLKRTAAALLACTLLLGLTGCFDYTEDAKFDEKGAGKLSIVFNLGDLSPIEKMAAALVKKNPFSKESFEKDLPAGVKLAEYKEVVENEQKKIFITYEFDDLNKLAQARANDKDDLIFKNISLTKVNDVWIFSRSVKYKDKEQLENAKKHLSRSKIVLKLTGPGKLVKEQSNPMRVEGENTCVWEGTFPELIEGKDGSGTVMKAQYDVGKFPTGLVIGLVAAVVVVVAAGGVLMMRKKPA
ncbi:MAG: hypothetical protein KIS92_18135 [Planctomycetota bacterium]|nr:hypothetical protein [Planctomycetota bacterium]